MRHTRGEWAVLGFTFAYVAGFTLFFVSQGNGEFLWYAATMVLLVVLVGWLAHRASVPVALLWALTGWGLAHMAGGGVPVGDTVLYGVQLLPLGGEGELRILKYDQAVHAYGFGVTAWLLWYLISHHHPSLRGSRTLLVVPALGAMGLGAGNEMVEFAAVLIFPQTGVGGYYNTALDLVFNATGAVLAMAVIWLANRRTTWPH
jgi:putative membrane protein